jgi:hypothetical protein
MVAGPAGEGAGLSSPYAVRLLRVGDVEHEPALVVRRVNEPLGAVPGREDRRREAAADDVGEHVRLAVGEIDGVDVVDAAVAVRREEEALAVGGKGRVLVVRFSVGDSCSREPGHAGPDAEDLGRVPWTPE